MSGKQEIRAIENQIWAFDQNSLRPGDIVLERGRSKFSSIIMLFDHGKYSHALLWLGGGDFLESVSSGVRPISFARVIVRDPEDWVVLRHPDPHAGVEAARMGRTLAHKKYDLWGAIASRYPLARLDPVRMFCSQLVASAYEKAGFPLISDKAAYQITPNMLIRNTCLASVEPKPLVSISKAHQEYASGLLDRDKAYKYSPLAREIQIVQTVFDLIRPMYPSLAWPVKNKLFLLPSDLYEAIELLQFLDDETAKSISDRMVKELVERGYFNLAYGYLEHTVQQRMQELAGLTAGVVTGEDLLRLEAHMHDIKPGRAAALTRHQQNAIAYEQMWNNRPLQIFWKYKEMHNHIYIWLGLIIKKENAILDKCQ